MFRLSHHARIHGCLIVGGVVIIADRRNLSAVERRKVVDGCELENGGEDEEETYANE